MSLQVPALALSAPLVVPLNVPPVAGTTTGAPQLPGGGSVLVVLVLVVLVVVVLVVLLLVVLLVVVDVLVVLVVDVLLVVVLVELLVVVVVVGVPGGTIVSANAPLCVPYPSTKM